MSDTDDKRLLDLEGRPLHQRPAERESRQSAQRQMYMQHLFCAEEMEARDA